MAVTFYVDTDTGVNDTSSRGSAGSPFRTLEYALNGAGGIRSTNNYLGTDYGDLVTATETLIINCSGATADAKAWVTGFTTNVTYFITINGEGNNSGKYDTGKYRIEHTAAQDYDWCMKVEVGYTVVNDVQAKMTNSSTWRDTCGFTSVATTTNVTYNRCIAVGVLGASVGVQCQGFKTSGTGTGHIIRNCLAYDFDQNTGSGFRTESTGTNGTECSNCTAYNCVYGFNTTYQDGLFKNCLAMSCTDGFNGDQINSDYNASDIAADAPGTNSQNGTAATFVNAAGGDFTPALSDTVAKGNGTDLSGSFTDDLAGNTRATWDIGALIANSTPLVESTMSNNYGVSQPGLSAIQWAWFDENIGALNAPTAQGSVETTDLSGAFSVDVTGTALTSGQTGTLVLYDSTGAKYGAYRAIIGSNGTLRFANPGIGGSFYFDAQANVIGVTAAPPMGPLR